MRPNYVGIAGAATDAVTTNTSPATPAGAGGRVSGAGILVPYGGIKVEHVVDGSSNTLMVGEQSDFLRNSAGTTRKHLNSSSEFGFMMGCRHDANRQPPPRYQAGSGDARSFNTTTVLYQINQWCDDTGAEGVNSNFGNNMPFTSPHPNIAVFAFADGSVRTLDNNTPLTTLQALASRMDGVSPYIP